MSQQINLFNPLFIKRVEYFSASKMLQALAVLIAGLAVFWGYSLRQEASLEAQAADSTREIAFQKERITRLSAEFSPGAAQKKAEEELRTAQAAIASRESLLRQIQGAGAESSAGYSEFLRAFSRQIVNGVWLTGVQIDEGAQHLTLTGNALRADLVPAFIRRLGAEKSLQGRSFDSLTISQASTAPERKPPLAPSYVAFRLSSADTQMASGAGDDAKGATP